VYVDNEAELVLSTSVFKFNTGNGGGTVMCDGASAAMDACTFFRNSAPSGAAIYARDSASIEVNNTIIAVNLQGEPVFCLSSTVTLSCCDVYGNQVGDWVGCIASQAGLRNNISADPLFCATAGPDNLHLAENSPCADAGVCGQIGRYGVACVSPVEPTTWGAIKASFQ
jgi:predicted outer membrane repeat protein